jgi:hypothetical protein
VWDACERPAQRIALSIEPDKIRVLSGHEQFVVFVERLLGLVFILR